MKNIGPYLQSIKNKKLLIIFPHPDDESFATGRLLLKAKSLGFQTTLVTLTHGENGHSNIQKGKILSKVRWEELKNSSKILRIDNLIQLNLGDSKLKENALKLRNEIVKVVNEVRPGVIVTYDLSGFTGHPDHIATSIECIRVSKKNNIPLLWYIPSTLTKKLVPNLAREYESTPQYILRSAFNFRKAIAFFKHSSQTNVKSIPYNIATFIFLLFSSENYHLVDLKREYRYKYFPFKFE